MKTIADLERTIADLRQSLEGMRLARAEDHAAVARRDKRIAELELELGRRPSPCTTPGCDGKGIGRLCSDCWTRPPAEPALIIVSEAELAAAERVILAEGTAPGNVEDRCASCGVAVPKGWECCAACFHVGR